MNIGRHHGSVKDGRGLLRLRDHHAAGNRIPGLHFDLYIPFFLSVERIHRDAAGDELSGQFRDLVERTLDAVEDPVQNPRPQCDRKRRTGPDDRLPGDQSACLLVYLDRRHVPSDGNHFADQPFLPDIDHLRHLESDRILHIDDGAVDSIYNACFFSHHRFLRQMRTTLSPLPAFS